MAHQDDVMNAANALMKPAGWDAPKVVVSIPKPEWWTPSEHVAPSVVISELHLCIRSVAAIYKYNRDVAEIKIAMNCDPDAFIIAYDTPEHRDEDYARLKNALGVE